MVTIWRMVMEIAIYHRIAPNSHSRGMTAVKLPWECFREEPWKFPFKREDRRPPSQYPPSERYDLVDKGIIIGALHRWRTPLLGLRQNATRISL